MGLRSKPAQTRHLTKKKKNGGKEKQSEGPKSNKQTPSAGYPHSLCRVSGEAFTRPPHNADRPHNAKYSGKAESLCPAITDTAQRSNSTQGGYPEPDCARDQAYTSGCAVCVMNTTIRTRLPTDPDFRCTMLGNEPDTAPPRRVFSIDLYWYFCITRKIKINKWHTLHCSSENGFNLPAQECSFPIAAQQQ